MGSKFVIPTEIMVVYADDPSAGANSLEPLHAAIAEEYFWTTWGTYYPTDNPQSVLNKYGGGKFPFIIFKDQMNNISLGVLPGPQVSVKNIKEVLDLIAALEYKGASGGKNAYYRYPGNGTITEILKDEYGKEYISGSPWGGSWGASVLFPGVNLLDKLFKSSWFWLLVLSGGAWYYWKNHKTITYRRTPAVSGGFKKRKTTK